MAGSLDHIEADVKRLLQQKLPEFDHRQVVLIESDPKPRDLAGVEAVDFLGCIRDVALFAYKAGSEILSVIAVPIRKYSALTILVALVLGERLPQPADLALAVRQKAIDVAVERNKPAKGPQYALVPPTMPTDLQLRSAQPERYFGVAVRCQPFRLPMENAPIRFVTVSDANSAMTNTNLPTVLLAYHTYAAST